MSTIITKAHRPFGSLSRRTFLQAATAAGAAMAVPGWARAASLSGILTHTITGATNGQIQNEELWDPFAAKHGIEHLGVSLGADGQLPRLVAEIEDPSIDLYIFVNNQWQYTHRNGFYRPIRQSEIIASMPESSRGPDGSSQQIARNLQGIIYRTDKISTPPQIEDLFKPELAPHVLIPRMGSTFGTAFAIMLARHFGGDENNMDVAFQKIGELVKAGALISTGPGDVPRNFDTDSWLMWYDHGMATQLRGHGLSVDVSFVEAGIPTAGSTAVIVKNAKNPDAAEAFIDFALQADRQKVMWERLGWFPVNPNTDLGELPASFPSIDKINASLVQLDGTLIFEKSAEWLERWDREVAV